MKKTKLNFLIIGLMQIFLLITLPLATSFLIKQTLIVSADTSSDICCCGKTKDGEFCKNVAADYANCSMSLIFERCDDLECSKEAVENSSITISTEDFSGYCCRETEDGEFCKNVSADYMDCKMSLVFGSCEDVGCKRVVMNQPVLPDITLPDTTGLMLLCCPETINGVICEDIPSTNPQMCINALLPTTCENTAGCEIGCCYDTEEGLCTPKATKQRCEYYKGDWYNNLDCNPSEVSQCQKGCCILGNQVKFVTEKRCEKLSLERGYGKSFKKGLTEIDCLALSPKVSEAINNSKDCIDEEGNKKRHGESWCIYDSYIGDGKDPPGSIHWKGSCIDGEIMIKSCGDYRGEICAQSEIKEGGNSFKLANCVINEASMCFDYNSEENKSIMKEKCNENAQCVIKNINVDSNFKFDVCVGKYPKGFSLEEPEKNKDACSAASQTCTVIYKKNWAGSWKCKKNCNCRNKEFAEQMNDLCISVGDCGSYINYVGNGTNNIQVIKSPEVYWTDYIDYAKPVEGQYAEHQNLNKSLGRLVGNSELLVGGESGFIKTLNSVGQLAGTAGSLVSAVTYLTGKSLFSAAATEYFPSSVFISEVPASSSAAGATNVAGAFSGAAIGAVMGMAFAGYLNKKFGISGDAAKVMTLAGGVTGAAVGYMYMTEFVMGFAAGAGIAGAVIMAYIIIMGVGKTKEVKVEFICMAWQPPIGSKDCERCDENVLKPCSQYKCSSLGIACKFLNGDTETPTCVDIPYEPNPPVISPGIFLNYSSPLNQLSGIYQFQNSEVKRVEIRKQNNDCIQENTKLLFTLETDEYSRCRYDFENKGIYEGFSKYSNEQNAFAKNHSFEIHLPNLNDLEPHQIQGDLKEQFANVDIYVKCQDYHGNFNIAPYMVNFCINSEPDKTPAIITSFEPKDKSVLKFGTDKITLKAYLKEEPAECKYDTEPGKDYEEMRYSMNCNTNLDFVPLSGWLCTAVLSNLTEEENKFYFKCKDKPWVKTPEDIEKYGERNINEKDIVYTLFTSDSKLSIDSMFPQGIIERNAEPVSLDLEIKTSGGAENGEAVCKYQWGGDWIEFKDTFSNIHKQEGLNLIRGKYEIPVKCEDSAGNIVFDKINFELKIDNSAPKVIRAYYEGNELVIITDEKAECYSSFSTCDFNLETEEIQDMTTALSDEHSIYWKTGKTYHIKCKDSWDNLNPGCAIKIKTQ